MVLRTIAALFREYMPLRIFGLISLICFILCLACGIPVIMEFAQTAYITHLPLAVAATGSGILAALFLVCGLILDSNTRAARKQFELMAYAALRESRHP